MAEPLARFRSFLHALSNPTVEMYMAEEQPSAEPNPEDMPVPNQILDANLNKSTIDKMQKELQPVPTTPSSYRPGSSPLIDKWVAQSKAMQGVNKSKAGRLTSNLTEQR